MTALEDYRRRFFSPERIVNFFAKRPRGAALFGGAPGLGKTELTARALPALLEQFPKVVVAASQHRILDEIEKRLQPFKPSREVPRDPVLCGPERDSEWARLYRLNLSAIGKSTICRSCPKRSVCSWAEQSSQSVDARVMLMTQDYLFRNPEPFGEGTLIILDELRFLEFPLLREIRICEFKDFVKILESAPALGDLANAAKDADVRTSPQLPDENVLFKLFLQLAREDVPNLLPAVVRTGPLWSSGEKYFYKEAPLLPGALLVLGYGATAGLLGHFFERSFLDLSPEESFVHPETKLYRLASTSTSYDRFRRNPRSRDGIYRFVLSKIRTNKTAGRKTLLVGKARLIGLIIDELSKLVKLEEELKFVRFDGKDQVFDGLSEIPIIHYGIEGINRFQNYESVICLNAYNIPESLLKKRLGELGFGIDIDVRIQHLSSGVRTVVTQPHIPLAHDVFDYLERNKALQTVSRARPWTTPTEVIFAGFQKFGDEIVVRDVRDLSQLFGFDNKGKMANRCEELRHLGKTHEEIGREINRCDRTVRRLLKENKE